MTWEMVVGLEVHAELSTKSKLFCGCTTAFGGGPNTHVCPVCLGLPGSLPRLNRAVVDYALRLGLALGGTITQYSKFDRKNYFYPDLPKAYQVSQLYAPICRDAHLDIDVGGSKKRIDIREIHMEEDAGKLLHDPEENCTWIDYNRCGVPLLEIVSEPDFRHGAEVIAYLEALRETLLYLDVCDCKMQEGSLRADINLSVRPQGEHGFGVRTEMKNLNSFKAIGRAMDFEAARQIKILEAGGRIVQETLRWDDDKGVALSMRTKENAQDYRYFPEPDLLPMEIEDAWIETIRQSLPELAGQKRERYRRDFGLSAVDAATLTSHKTLSSAFESIARKSGEPREAANLMTGEISRLMNRNNILPEQLAVDCDKLATLIGFVTAGKINRNAYKETVEAVFLCDAEPEDYITDNKLWMRTDGEDVRVAVEAVLMANQKSVAEYRDGKEKAFGFLMGQAMKQLAGQGNPAVVRQVLEEMLGREV